MSQSGNDYLGEEYENCDISLNQIEEMLEDHKRKLENEFEVKYELKMDDVFPVGIKNIGIATNQSDTEYFTMMNKFTSQPKNPFKRKLLAKIDVRTLENLDLKFN